VKYRFMRFTQDNRKYLRIASLLPCFALALALFSTAPAHAGDPIPTPVWTDFFGTSAMFNGKPAPVGSLVEALDPDGVLCGKFVVKTAGEYGFMPTYGDDVQTGDVDEGAVAGDEIAFRVNGRPAVAVGQDLVFWVAGPTAPVLVNLEATGTLGFQLLEDPLDQFAAPGDEVFFSIIFRNTGDVTDFYKLEVTSNLGWELDFPTDFIYYPAGTQTRSATFSVTVPFDITGGLSDQLTFSLTSGLDPANGASGVVNVFVLVTDVDEDDGAVLPSTFDLGQNYPNPFNPTTKIPFTLRVSSEVSLSVYNVLGQKIDALNLGVMSSGAHTVEYKPSTQSSGVYFYKIVAGDFTATRRMILLK
jgi:Secretion system C-terminal sorting domain